MGLTLEERILKAIGGSPDHTAAVLRAVLAYLESQEAGLTEQGAPYAAQSLCRLRLKIIADSALLEQHGARR